MEAWSVLVWNMALGSPPRRNVGRNWKRLTELMTEESVNVALLNEAVVRPGTEIIYGTGGTQGRDGKARPWSTAIVSKHGPREIRDARPTNYLGHERNRLPFENSRPGSWTAATVQIPNVGPVTCVALYGLLDDLSEASVHRSLSELSPIFSDKRYNQRVILGGDLNTSTQWPEGGHLDRDRGVLERIESYGLIDCLKAKREPLPECPCTLDECTHTRTTWDADAEDGGVPYQMDYIFASPDLVEGDRLQSCRALHPTEWNADSDHAPIIATFMVS